MAGDWIPYTKELPSKLEVLQIANTTGRSRHEVVGLLMDFWAWADSQTEDGWLPGVSVAQLSSLVVTSDVTFWRAVCDVTWIKEETGGIRLPNFTVWMSCSAKKRLRNNRNQQKNRNKNGTFGPPRPSDVTGIGDISATKRVTTEQNSTIEDPPFPPQGETVAKTAPEQTNAAAPAVVITAPVTTPATAPVAAPVAAPVTAPVTTPTVSRSEKAARITASDHPALHPIAVRLAKLYDARVGTANISGGRIALIEVLAGGAREQDLEASIEHYAAHVVAHRIAPTKRKGAANFFREGLWEEFVNPRQVPVDAPPEGTKRRKVEPIALVRAREEARLAASKAPGVSQERTPDTKTTQGPPSVTEAAGGK